MPARLRSLAVGALIGVAAILGRAHAEDISAAQRALVERYVAAITAQDATALKALFHPATRACVNSANEDFFEFLFGNDLRFESDLKDGYKLTSFDTAYPSMSPVGRADRLGGGSRPPGSHKGGASRINRRRCLRAGPVLSD